MKNLKVTIDRGLVWLIREPVKPSDKAWYLSFHPDTALQLAHQLAVAAAAISGQGLPAVCSDEVQS